LADRSVFLVGQAAVNCQLSRLSSVS